VTEADRGGWRVEDLASVVDTAVEAFGPQRLMFGSDWPVCLLAATYGRWVATAEELLAPLGAEDRARVWAGTAVDVYLGGILPAVG
jgi:L-fuconolactonase